jgi:poly(A) polymerase
MPEVPALHQASTEVVSTQQQSTSIPRRFSMPMREIWDLQLRLPKRAGHKAEQLMENRRFRAAYDFLLLREESGETDGDLGQWWTDYQTRSPDQRSAMSKSLSSKPPRKRRQRQRNSPPDNSTTP